MKSLNRRARSSTCPCISPHTVTGVLTGCMLDSSIRISQTISQSCLRSLSGKYLHSLAISIHLSTSTILSIYSAQSNYTCCAEIYIFLMQQQKLFTICLLNLLWTIVLLNLFSILENPLLTADHFLHCILIETYDVHRLNSRQVATPQERV